MVYIDGVKYACERCIRGHRVSTCKHTDQPLTMIKPKGRPTTQCAHCREVRKSRLLHTKCTCGVALKQQHQHTAPCPCALDQELCTCTKKKRMLTKSRSPRPQRESSSDGLMENSSDASVNESIKSPYSEFFGFSDLISPLHSQQSLPWTYELLGSGTNRHINGDNHVYPPTVSTANEHTSDIEQNVRPMKNSISQLSGPSSTRTRASSVSSEEREIYDFLANSSLEDLVSIDLSKQSASPVGSGFLTSNADISNMPEFGYSSVMFAEYDPAGDRGI